jgi:hypothetical protein
MDIDEEYGEPEDVYSEYLEPFKAAERLRNRKENQARQINPADKRTDEDIAAIVTKWSGGLYLSASEIGCTRHQLIKRIKSSPQLEEFLSEYEEMVADYAELNVKSGVIRGDRDYTKFYLTHKSASRGYAARTEVTGANGSALQLEQKTTVDLSSLSTEVLREIAKLSTNKAKEEKTPLLEGDFKVLK